jgi:hypothetical protein
MNGRRGYQPPLLLWPFVCCRRRASMLTVAGAGKINNAMSLVTALPLILLGYVFLWPLVHWLLHRQAAYASPLETALVTTAASVGGLSWILFWLGLLPGTWLNGWSALAVVLLGVTAGLLANPGWAAPRRWLVYWQAQVHRLLRCDIESLLSWATLAVLAVIAINDLYLPFVGDDTLIRYGRQAQLIYLGKHIPLSVAGYPPLAPISYAVTWFAAGWPNEHLARLFPAVMAGGAVAAAYLLGRDRLVPGVQSRLAGLIAAALVVLTPMFVHNAALAYTDIPTAFPLTLALYYILRWWDSGLARDSVLAGVLLGIAAFTKQSALTWFASALFIPLLWLAANRQTRLAHRWQRAARGWMGFLLPALIIAGPWYIRNIAIGGWRNAVPVAGLYHILGPGSGLLGLVPSLAWPDQFGPPLAGFYVIGWVSGLIYALRQGWELLRGTLKQPPVDLILAAAAIPYWLAWLARFSFDARFFLLILPLMAFWTARPALRVIRWFADRVKLPRWAWMTAGMLLLISLVVWGARDRLGGVYRAVTQPFATDAERFAYVHPDLYGLVQYAREELDPAVDNLCAMDERIVYLLPEYNVRAMYPLELEDLDGCDYLFHSSGFTAVYADGRLGLENSEFYLHVWDTRVFEPVHVVNGIHVMKVLRTTAPEGASRMWRSCESS